MVCFDVQFPLMPQSALRLLAANVNVQSVAHSSWNINCLPLAITYCFHRCVVGQQITWMQAVWKNHFIQMNLSYRRKAVLGQNGISLLGNLFRMLNFNVFYQANSDSPKGETLQLLWINHNAMCNVLQYIIFFF